MCWDLIIAFTHARTEFETGVDENGNVGTAMIRRVGYSYICEEHSVDQTNIFSCFSGYGACSLLGHYGAGMPEIVAEI